MLTMTEIIDSQETQFEQQLAELDDGTLLEVIADQDALPVVPPPHLSMAEVRLFAGRALANRRHDGTDEPLGRPSAPAEPASPQPAKAPTVAPWTPFLAAWFGLRNA
jgi:hypothetical protein